MPSTEPSTEAIEFDLHLGSSQDQSEFDLAFFDHILRRNPNHVDVLRRQVELLARLDRYQDALQLDYRLVHLRPQDVIARYNLACTLSMVGDTSEALTVLDQALGLGYCDLAHLETDPDLDPVRQLDGYSMILAKHGHIVDF